MDVLNRTAIGLAEKIDRRRFIRRSAQTVFATATGWSLLGSGVAWSATDGPCPNPNKGYDCVYPGDRACRSWSASYCDGSKCAGSCSYWVRSEGGLYVSGCWCGKAYCTPGGRYGYFRCCDCDSCGNHTVPCGCRIFHEIRACRGGPGRRAPSPGPEPDPSEVVQGAFVE